MQRNINYSETFAISIALSSIAISSPFAKTRIIHDNELNPFAYAIGFGCNYNSSVIVGGIEDDEISAYQLLKFAQDISKAYGTNKTIMGIDVTKVLSKKGVWIIPSFKACKEEEKALNFIENKISPKRMLELCGSETGIKLDYEKEALQNTKLLTYFLSSSSGNEIEACGMLPEDSLSEWFYKTAQKPAIRLEVGKDNINLAKNGENILYKKLTELLLLYIIS